MKHSPKLTLISFSVIAALAPKTLYAEEKTEQNVEKIIVTATKRNADVQDVSLSVTALSKEDLAEGGIVDITRLEHLVPGLKFGQSGNEVRLALRGTRTNNVGTEAEQVVGIFEDGVYVATTTQALGAYVDVDRIEVLRGPQGTLYGRNTFGGTINIHTRAPQFDDIEGYVHALYGDFSRTRFEGAVNVPMTETLAARVAFMKDEHDGIIENTFRPGKEDDLRDKDLSYFRGILRWAPSSTLDVTLRMGQSTSKGNGDAIWGYQQIGAYVDGQYQDGHIWAPEDASDNFDQGPYTVSRNLPSGVDLDTKFYTLQVDWDVEFAVIKYTANLTDFEGRQFYDSDYTDGGSSTDNSFTGWDSSQETMSHELQMISQNDSDFEWILGAYYFDQTSNWNWLDRVNGELREPHWDNQGDFNSDSLGIFGNATYSVTDKSRVVGGLRYARDTKKQRGTLDWSNADFSNWPFVTGIVYDEDGGIEETWSKVLWKFAYEYDLSVDELLYLQASTGYRAGGNNFIQEGVPASYDPEEVTAYEAGYKSTHLDNTLTLNIAAYLNQYTNMQAQSFAIINNTVSEFTENGGELDAMGLEVELNWTPTEQWNVSAQLALMDAEFGDYRVSKVDGLGDINDRANEPTDSPLINLKGWKPALASDVTLGLQISYDFEFSNGSVLRPYFQTSYASENYASDFNLDGVKQDGYTKSDFRLIWQSKNNQYEVQAFVLNIEDEAVLNRVAVFNPGPAPTIASLQANWGNPRTWGVSVSYNF